MLPQTKCHFHPLRRALAALRQHPRERAFDRRDHGRRLERTLRPGRANSPVKPLACSLLEIAAANSREIETNVPKVQRRVGGYAGNGQDVSPTPSPRVVLRLIAGLGQLMHGFATATVASKPDPLTKFDDFDGADPHRIATSGAAQHARSLPYYRQRVPSYHLDCAPTLGGA
jgi:hypothetical protein